MPLPKLNLLPKVAKQAAKAAEPMRAAPLVRRSNKLSGAPPRAYTRLARDAQTAGGFTYDVKTGAQPKRGFAFSASPENEAILGELTPEAIAGYVAAHEEALAPRDAYLGARRASDGRWFLDVSKVVPDREVALAEARKARQLAVYDLSAGESIAVAPQMMPAHEPFGGQP